MPESRTPSPEFDPPGEHISMLRNMPPSARGAFLPTKEYVKAFWSDYARPEVTYLDKVESGQLFQEPGFDSWEACRRGAWSTAVALLRDQPALDKHFREAAERQMFQRRLRYIECPPTDYIVWEMAVLNERVARGEQIRVASTDAKPGFQAPPPLVF
ncbi:DUF6879 family protein [Streptomyces sp. NPDC050095]|uniref:DUF6879 family protein n=1 Tax=Streptomyces sp. NPDC050095 TaxID=3155512 RepID=UPI00342DDFD6